MLVRGALGGGRAPGGGARFRGAFWECCRGFVLKRRRRFLWGAKAAQTIPPGVSQPPAGTHALQDPHPTPVHRNKTTPQTRRVDEDLVDEVVAPLQR